AVVMVQSGDDDVVGMMMVLVVVWRPNRGGKAREGECCWGSGRSGHEDNIWFRPERSPENFFGGGGMVAGGGGGRREQ
ncbi:hypothetical protein Tco_0912220, partial [Tanacetum coccineum]